MRPLAALALLLTAGAAGAQEVMTLEQAASRSGHDLSAVYEGSSVMVRGQVASPTVWAVGSYYIALRDNTDHGLLLTGSREQFAELRPGEWIEVQGGIQSRAGCPMLAPVSIHKVSDEAAPAPKELTLAELDSFRYLGLWVRTHATVSSVGENLGGKVLEVTDHGHSISVFLARASNSTGKELSRVRTGDQVRLTGLASQYSPEPPYYGNFELILGSPEDVEVVEGSSALQPLLIAGGAAAIALLIGLWWVRDQRAGSQRRSLRAFHALSEEIISAASPAVIAEKLVRVLPTVTRATAVRLYLYNRRTKSLECVATSIDPDPMAVSIDSPQDGLASGAAACFRNRTRLNVPDVRRSPFVRVEMKTNLPRAAMFVPLFAQNDVLGVLEVSNARRAGYFTQEEQAAVQHLANQVAASLKLQEQQTMREHVFQSEKLAATGQLISGVANELRAPLENILQLATSIGAYRGRPAPGN